MSFDQSGVSSDPGGSLAAILRKSAERIGGDSPWSGVLRTPARRGAGSVEKGMHVHLHPELFLQLNGFTDFSFPTDRFDLMPGDICLVPSRAPHRERGYPHGGAPFLNIVVMPVCDSVGICFLDTGEDKIPRFLHSWRSRADARAIRARRYIDESVDAMESSSGRCGCTLADALIRASLATLADLVEAAPPAVARHSPKVAQCLSIVETSFADPALDVGFLASRLRCSPAYLSHLFRQEMGERLSAHISRKRMEHAKGLLEETALTVSEIAWACGHENPGYFIQAFKTQCGVTPGEYHARAASGVS